MMLTKQLLYLVIMTSVPLLSLEEKDFSSHLTQIPQSQQQLYKKIASDLRCPNCIGLSVLDSDTTFSQQIKNKIMALINEDHNESDIVSFFTKRYGLWILRQPPKEGVHLIIWLLPFVFLIAGPMSIYFLWWYKKNKPETPEKSTITDDDLTKQFHQDLALFKAKGHR